jgi:hypothetical protein
MHPRTAYIALIENRQDLIFSNACDLLSLSQQDGVSFRDRMIKLVEDDPLLKAKCGDILERFKTDKSENLRRSHPDAWAVEYKMDYETQVIFSDYCEVFSRYKIALNITIAMNR